MWKVIHGENLTRIRTFYNEKNKNMKEQFETTDPNNIINFLKKSAPHKNIRSINLSCKKIPIFIFEH